MGESLESGYEAIRKDLVQKVAFEGNVARIEDIPKGFFVRVHYKNRDPRWVEDMDSLGYYVGSNSRGHRFNFGKYNQVTLASEDIREVWMVPLERWADNKVISKVLKMAGLNAQSSSPTRIPGYHNISPGYSIDSYQARPWKVDFWNARDLERGREALTAFGFVVEDDVSRKGRLSVDTPPEDGSYREL